MSEGKLDLGEPGRDELYWPGQRCISRAERKAVIGVRKRG